MSHAPAEPLSVEDVAKRFGVSNAETIRRWAAAGKIPAWRTPGGHWRFDADAIEAYIATRGDEIERDGAA